MLLARSTTSSTCEKGRTLTTGPKISSRAMAMSSLTLSKMVGSTKKPLVADACAAGQELGALLLAEVDVVEDLVHLLLRDLRPLLGGGVERVADGCACWPSRPGGRRTRSWIFFSTNRRLPAVQHWPPWK